MDSVKMRDMYFGLYDKMRRKLIQISDRRACQERLSGKDLLTTEQKKQIEEFYAPYCKVTTIFHQMFYEKTGVFSEKYLPIDIYTNIIDEYLNPRTEAKFLDNKCYYASLFNGLKQPEFAVCRCGGFWYNGEMQIIDEAEVKAIVSAEEELFVKEATDSYGGKGILYISKEKGDMVEQFEKFVSKGDFIAQRPVRQHKDLGAVNESSVNTIRLISLLSNEGIKIYSSILRVGQKGAKCDNATSGGVAVGITEDGKLKKYGYEITGKRYDIHPTNGFVFEGHQIPSYDKAVEMVKKAHPMVPHFRLVSWDICIGEDGEPILLEANLCKGGIVSHQYNNGPLFGEDTKKVLDEIFGIK